MPWLEIWIVSRWTELPTKWCRMDKGGCPYIECSSSWKGVSGLNQTRHLRTERLRQAGHLLRMRCFCNAPVSLLGAFLEGPERTASLNPRSRTLLARAPVSTGSVRSSASYV